MSQILRQSTQVVVRVGPFVDVGDGFTPETGITLSGADEAELLKANGAATVDISGATWAAITGADGWYNLTLTTSHTDTIGTLGVVVNDDSVCLPVFVRFQVIEEAAYDAMFASGADPKADINLSSIDAAAATSLTEDIAEAIIAELGTRGSAAIAGITASSTDVDVANNALDLLTQGVITAFTDGTPEADWLTRNYGVTRDGELRDFTWKFAKRRRKLYPLDFAMRGLSGTLSGAWGFLRLTEDYSGDLVTIRRSSDSTTDDFGWEEDSLIVDADAIETFVGSGNTGYVSQLWDQTGNGRHLAQATTTKQPVFTSEIETGTTDRPGASFDGTDDLLATSGALSNLISTTAGYIVVVGLVDSVSLNSSTASANHVIVADSALEHGLSARLGGRLYGFNDDGSEDSVTDAVPVGVNSDENPQAFVAELRHDSGTLYTRVNLGDEESTTSGTTASLAGALNVGDVAAGSQALDFKLFAVLTFSTAPNDADRARLVRRLMRWVDAGGMGEFGWTYRYPLPSDCARVIRITSDGKFEGPTVEGEVEDGDFLTDQPAPLYLLYGASGLDASHFDPLFKEALSAKIAMKGAHFFTGKASMLQVAQNAYDNAIRKAKRAGSIEGSMPRSNDPEVIETRI
jgi:hypothetical protein